MRDKRPVGDLSIEELERVLAIKRRKTRQKQMERMRRSGRVVQPDPNTTNTVTHSQPPSRGTLSTSVEVAPRAQEQPADPPKAEALPPMTTDIPHFEDDSRAIEYNRPYRAKDNRAWKQFVNGSLLIVEIASVAGLIYLGVNMVGTIGRLEQETSAAQQAAESIRRASIPTLEPTPALRFEPAVLPGGHTFDEVTDQPLINYSEIPDSVPPHLLPAIQSELLRPSIARPHPTKETALTLIIPKLNKDSVIVQGADWEALQQGVGQILNGYNPSDPIGNIALSAHNDIYGEIFRDLDQLEPGDEFIIQTELDLYRYRVTRFEIVNPTDVHVLQSQGRATATLISCYPYKVNTQRYIVYADQVDT